MDEVTSQIQNYYDGRKEINNKIQELKEQIRQKQSELYNIDNQFIEWAITHKHFELLMINQRLIKSIVEYDMRKEKID